MNNNQFNQKYGISDNLATKLRISTNEKNSNNIAGKPKILALEIMKRFFSNPIVIIAAIVFIFLIVTALVVKYTSPYPAVKSIDTNWKVGTSDHENLPPIFAPFKITSDKQIIKRLREMKTGEFKHWLSQYAVYESLGTGARIINYDAYKYWKGMMILHELKEWKDAGNPVSSLTSSKFAELAAKVPELKTFFGTNLRGADIWTTVWAGVLESMRISLIVAIIETTVGVVIGCYLGFNAGKKIDTFMMRVIEIFQAPPSIIWLLLFVSIWGTSEWILIAALLFVGWTYPIGYTRMFIITVKDEEYITAAKSIGCSMSRQVFVHALPAIVGKIAMNFVRRVPSIILTIASLAFLGFFNDDSSANLGKFMLDNIGDSEQNAWLLILPALILLALSVSLQFIAIGLHDALDPKIIKAKK